MTLRADYEHWARSFSRRVGEGWGAFLDRIHSDVTYALVSGNDGDTDVTAAQLEELTDGSNTTLHDHEFDYAHISADDASTDVTGAQLEELTDGSETTLHSHAGGSSVSFRAEMSGAQAIATASVVTLVWGTESYDNGSNFASNTFTAPSAGVYGFSAGCQFAANATGTRMIEIVVGGTTSVAKIAIAANAEAGISTNLSTACECTLAASAAVTARAYQSSGGDLNLGTSATFFSGHLIKET